MPLCSMNPTQSKLNSSVHSFDKHLFTDHLVCATGAGLLLGQLRSVINLVPASWSSVTRWPWQKTRGQPISFENIIRMPGIPNYQQYLLNHSFLKLNSNSTSFGPVRHIIVLPRTLPCLSQASAHPIVTDGLRWMERGTWDHWMPITCQPCAK